MTTAIIDADFIRHAVACVGETRSVKVVHRESGRETEVKSRQEWWGHWSKKEGGRLAEINKGRETPFLPEDFDYYDVQTVTEPLSHVLHSCKAMYNSVVKAAGANKSKGFIGKGQTFRNDRATIWEYKGNRKNLITPLLMDEVAEYMEKKLGCEVVTEIEADDRVIIEAYNRPDRVVVACDKDALGCPVNVFNPDKPKMGVINGRQLGELWIDGKGGVRGYGRKFHYFQVSSGDSSDNYAANSASSMRWGAKSAYKELVDCTTDAECFEAMKRIYQKLYPEPKEIEGWRGDKITVDWKYCFNENWELSRMLRTMDELDNRIIGIDVMTKLGVDV